MLNDHLMIQNQPSYSLELTLTTAGGKITCLRCTAKSKRSKLQCARPAIKESRTQKCNFHGGKPHTPDMLKRISVANTIHGESSKVAREQYRRDSVLLRQLEDALYILKMADGPRTRGCKPKGYRGLYTEEDVIKMFSDSTLHNA
jgi:hypothetical protein